MSYVLDLIVFGLSLLSFSYLLIGTLYTCYCCLRPKKKVFYGEPISILKPVKGLDPGLESNLRSFFELAYDKYELIFGVEAEDDPAVPVIRKLIESYPQIPARYTVVPVSGGNPKVGLLEGIWAQASHPWLLVSDSNVCVEGTFLQEFAPFMRPETGVVTAGVRVSQSYSLGGAFESAYLNTTCTRSLFICKLFSNPYVIGKTMFFNKNLARRIGGFRTLSRYIAEDFMFGFAASQLGLKLDLIDTPVEQRLGAHSLKSYFSRHLRWGRIRKRQLPMVAALEILQSAFLGALLFGSFFRENPLTFFLAYLGVWCLVDWFQDSVVGKRFSLCFPIAWVGRELALPFQWLMTWAGNSVVWRGRQHRIQAGGLLAA